MEDDQSNYVSEEEADKLFLLTKEFLSQLLPNNRRVLYTCVVTVRMADNVAKNVMITNCPDDSTVVHILMPHLQEMSENDPTGSLHVVVTDPATKPN